MIETPGNHEAVKFAFSADGLTWGGYGEVTNEIWEAALVKPTLPRQVCRPVRPLECYRITGQPQVERSLDGGRSWQVDWEFPLERVDYTRRAGGLMGPKVINMAPLDLAVLELPDGPRVLAAMGDEGALVRLADGSWQRVAVINATPTPLKAENVADALSNLYIEVAAVGCSRAAADPARSRCSPGQPCSKRSAPGAKLAGRCARAGCSWRELSCSIPVAASSVWVAERSISSWDR